MKRTIYINLLITGILIISCNSKSHFTPVENICSDQNIEIDKDMVRIKIDSLTMHEFSYLQFVKTDSSEEFIGYNPETHAFDRIDLKDRVIRDHINLDRDGPDAIISMRGFFYHNEDTIFVFDGRFLSIVNSKSAVTSRFDLYPDYNDIEKSSKGYFLHSNYFSDIKYYPSQKSIYFRVVYNDRKLSDKNTARPMIAEFSLSKKEVVNLLPAFASELFMDNQEDYGLHSSFNYACGRKKIYYNFPSESNVYTITLDGTEKGIYGGKSSFIKNKADKLEPGEDYYFKYYKEEIFFYPLIYPIEENYFIRLHWGELPLKKVNNEFSLLEEKPLFITIFDKDLHYIKELELNNKDYYVGGAFCDRSAFYIFKNISQESNSDEIELYRFNIRFEK